MVTTWCHRSAFHHLDSMDAHSSINKRKLLPTGSNSQKKSLMMCKRLFNNKLLQLMIWQTIISDKKLKDSQHNLLYKDIKLRQCKIHLGKGIQRVMGAIRILKLIHQIEWAKMTKRMSSLHKFHIHRWLDQRMLKHFQGRSCQIKESAWIMMLNRWIKEIITCMKHLRRKLILERPRTWNTCIRHNRSSHLRTTHYLQIATNQDHHLKSMPHLIITWCHPNILVLPWLFLIIKKCLCLVQILPILWSFQDTKCWSHHLILIRSI